MLYLQVWPVPKLDGVSIMAQSPEPANAGEEPAAEISPPPRSPEWHQMPFILGVSTESTRNNHQNKKKKAHTLRKYSMTTFAFLHTYRFFKTFFPIDADAVEKPLSRGTHFLPRCHDSAEIVVSSLGSSWDPQRRLVGGRCCQPFAFSSGL